MKQLPQYYKVLISEYWMEIVLDEFFIPWNKITNFSLRSFFRKDNCSGINSDKCCGQSNDNLKFKNHLTMLEHTSKEIHGIPISFFF